MWIELPNGTKRQTDFNEIEEILKDTRFIRHELSNYSYLHSSQLSFTTHLNKNYWEYLFVKGKLHERERNELEEGALLVIHLWYNEIFEAHGGSFLYQNKLFEIIEDVIKHFKPDNDKKKKLRQAIEFSMKNYENDKLGDMPRGEPIGRNKEIQEQLVENDKWVYSVFVEQYFKELADSFEPNRIRTEEFNKKIAQGGKK